MNFNISVMRIGHRPERDQRITTHIGLVARAFGAEKMLLDSGDIDIKRSIEDVTERFGGNFSIEIDVDWRDLINEWEGEVVHLTMYGERVQDIEEKIRTHCRKNEGILIVVGARKVPGDMYEIADYNVAVTNQPHSEVAALAILLDRIYQGEELEYDFEGNIKVIPSKSGKKVKEF